MASRHALVVDDSKTARVTLKRMLEKQDIAVDTLESAQEALDYLVENSPDVIFMDHMMPGMDGFQALEAIKSHPETATIPIMMYTSKGGDLYVSQARALGAVGILPKEVQPAELYQILNNLGLVKDRRSKTAQDNSRLVMMPPAQEIAAQADSEDMQEIARKAADSIRNNKELHGYIGEVLEVHYHALRQDINDLRKDLENATGMTLAETSPAPFTGSGGGRTSLFVPLVLLLVMLIPLLWLYQLKNETQRELDSTRDVVARLQEIQYQQQQTAEQESTSLRTMLDSEQDRVSKQSSLLHTGIEWAVNLDNSSDLDEETFGDRRLAVIYELVSRLQALGFKGVVALESHLGEFCLSGNAVEGYQLAAADLPVSDCDLYGHPQQDLPLIGERQSIGFANFLATSPLVNDSGISIEIRPEKFNQPKLEYPSRHSDITAEEWNRIAAVNNRVEIKLVPSEALLPEKPSPEEPSPEEP